jgi:hypothetical protein
MKKTKCLFLLSFPVVLLMFASSCQILRKKTVTVSTIVEDHVSSGYSFPNGVYYLYKFQNEANQNFDDEALMLKLLKKRVSLKNIWYKKEMPQCVDFDGSASQSGAIAPVYLVQLAKEADKEMARLGFKKVKVPGMGNCAFRVKRFYIESSFKK